jgi:hypothetical protein
MWESYKIARRGRENMKVFQARCGWRALLCGLVFASLGFSFALATSPADVGARGISTNASRLPTTFFTPSDLGAVVVGSTFTRQIQVQYGFKPHVFTFGAQPPQSSLTISESGTISGKKADVGTEFFNVNVTDGFSVGNLVMRTISPLYSLEAIEAAQSPNLALQFAVPSKGAFALLPALAYEPYSYTIQANGGTPPYMFRLEEGALPVGLSLDSSGLLFGTPLAPGTYIFSLVVQDAALSLVEQEFSLQVVPNTVSNNIIPVAGKFTLNFAKKGGQDTLYLTLFIDKSSLANAGVLTTADLVNLPISLNFGGVQLPPTATNHPNVFDDTGTITFPQPLKGITPAKNELLNYTIRLNPVTGILNVAIRNASLIQGLGADLSSFENPVIPLNIQIGQSVTAVSGGASSSSSSGTSGGSSSSSSSSSSSGSTTSTLTVNFNLTDSIKFIYNRTTATGKGLALPGLSKSPGGMFMLTSLAGTELAGGTSNVTNDFMALKLSGVMRQPLGATLQPSTTDDVAVFLGPACIGFFPASSFVSAGKRLTFVNTDSVAAPLKSITIDSGSGAFNIETFPVNVSDVFNVNALVSGEPYSMPLTLTIASTDSVTFDGQSGTTVIRKGNSLSNK